MEFQQGDTFEKDYEVNDKIYNGFIATFDDRNPLHTDQQFAREKGFDGKVMHGAILAGFLSNFIGEQLAIKNVIVLSYSLSFNKPVYLGDKLKLAVEVDTVSPAISCVDFKFAFRNPTNVVVSKGKISIRII